MATFVEATSSLRKDGSRNFVQPADVSGRFTHWRRVLFVVLIGIYLALPFIQIHGHPAVFLDLVHGQFFLFGLTFNAQDFWLVFFLLTGLAFVLIVLTTLWGRVWCGYACPQTVFLEGIYRRIERWLEGPRAQRLRQRQEKLSFDLVWRKAVKHLLFVLTSLALAHFFLSYFVSLPSLGTMVQGSPSEHPLAFAWVMGISAVLYFNFSWFREQFCVIMCPYGRMQSVLTDDDTLVIGYDVLRGEPRGKVSETAKGDCIDCKRCVVVCPTGIDIRHGLQIDCIGCAACVDACDDIMRKIGRPEGLVRYDSLKGLEHKPKRFWRSRLALYAVLGLAGVLAAGFALSQHEPFEANLLRLRAAPYILEGDVVRNSLELHLINKMSERQTFQIEAEANASLQYTVAIKRVELAPLGSARLPIFASAKRTELAKVVKMTIRVIPEDYRKAVTLSAPFVAP